MKRYNMRDVTPYVTVHPDGEWIRYEDHVEAMKRIAGDGGQQVERETLISVLENEQNNLAASRRQCGAHEGARWDDLQRVIEYLSTATSASPADQGEDARMLDWLDEQNRKKNESHDTRYGWRYSVNHNRIALEDHYWPPITVREAIRAAMSASKEEA